MRKTQTRKRPEQEETRAETEPKTNTDGRHNDYAHPPVTLPRSERRFFLFSSSSINLWRPQPRPETYRGNKLGRKSFSFRAAKSSGVELPTGSRLIRPLRQSRKGTAQFGVERIAPFLCVRARSVLETISFTSIAKSTNNDGPRSNPHAHGRHSSRGGRNFSACSPHRRRRPLLLFSFHGHGRR